MSPALSAVMTIVGIAIVRALVWLLAQFLPCNRITVALFRERSIFRD